MSNQPSDHQSSSESEMERGAPPRTPRWVKIFAIVAVVVIVLVIVAFIVSGGDHGPGRHMPGRHNPSMQHR